MVSTTVKIDGWRTTDMNDWIDEMPDIRTVVSEMKKVGENYIKSEQLEARLLADWMYRFAQKIESLTV